MKKITIYDGEGFETKIYVMPEGKVFTIHDLGGPDEDVFENVSFTDASPEEEAVIRRHIKRTSGT